jgi:hypothetical protein
MVYAYFERNFDRRKTLEFASDEIKCLENKNIFNSK